MHGLREHLVVLVHECLSPRADPDGAVTAVADRRAARSGAVRRGHEDRLGGIWPEDATVADHIGRHRDLQATLVHEQVGVAQAVHS